MFDAALCCSLAKALGYGHTTQNFLFSIVFPQLLCSCLINEAEISNMLNQ